MRALAEMLSRSADSAAGLTVCPWLHDHDPGSCRDTYVCAHAVRKARALPETGISINRALIRGEEVVHCHHNPAML